jgi:hypothetical protein
MASPIRIRLHVAQRILSHVLRAVKKRLIPTNPRPMEKGDRNMALLQTWRRGTL